MIIEVRGTNSRNKGALMMLLTILERTGNWGVDKYVVAPGNNFPYEQRNKLGLHQKLWFVKGSIQMGYIMDRLVPDLFRKAYGLIGDSEIELVLDASGFAYSDQWGSRYPKTTAQAAKKWRRQNTKFILLPQAFGPFSDPLIKKEMRTVFENSNLIFARDKTSLSHVKSIYDGDVRLAPDFTNLLTPIPALIDEYYAPVAIVPNARMLDKVKDGGANYVQFLKGIASALGPDKAYFLIHEGVDDHDVAVKINSLIDRPLKVIGNDDPRVLKWMLAQSKLIVGSRYHALISALSQGVPSIGTGWSHKYAELFSDYGASDLLIDVENPEHAVTKVMDLFNGDALSEYSSIIEKNAKRIKSEARMMWDDVAKFLGIKISPESR